jgi:hypothetical protein
VVSVFVEEYSSLGPVMYDVKAKEGREQQKITNEFVVNNDIAEALFVEGMTYVNCRIGDVITIPDKFLVSLRIHIYLSLDI